MLLELHIHFIEAILMLLLGNQGKRCWRPGKQWIGRCAIHTVSRVMLGRQRTSSVDLVI